MNPSNIYVFLDTNSINSTSFENFFGQTGDLSRLSEMARIVIPQTVIDELLEHKKRHFDNKLKEIRKNPLPRLANVDFTALYEFDYGSLERQMLQTCPIQYDIARIHDSAKAFETIYELARQNKAPFDKGSDKGFKDACIVLSIDCFVDANPGAEKIIVVSDDSRIQDYYNKTSAKCVSNTSEAIELISALCDTPSSNYIISEVAGNQNHTQSSKTVAHSDSISSLINHLRMSKSFAETHSVIDRYKTLDFTHAKDYEGKAILESCIRNSQVYYILSDDDIRCFIYPIFSSYHQLLSDADYSTFVDSAGLPNERVDSEGNIQLSSCEKNAYRNFAQDLVAHIQSRSYGSFISTDVNNVIRALAALLAQQNIDEKAVSWQRVAEVFINGGVNASESPVSPKILRDFLSLLRQGSKAKAASIMSALRFRLEDIDEDIPF